MCSHVRRFREDAADANVPSDTDSLTAKDWRIVFFTCEELVTRGIVLKGAAGKHLRQELAAMHHLLSFVIVL